MTTLAFWLALLRALPELIAFLRSLSERAQSARDRREGYDEAVAAGLREAHEGLKEAMAAINEAREKHRADPTDDAFDKTWMRTD